MKKLFYPAIIAMMLMSQGCFVRDLARKLDLSRLWKKPEPEAVAADEIPLDQIHWHEGAEIADWPITHKLTVSIGQSLSLAQGGSMMAAGTAGLMSGSVRMFRHCPSGRSTEGSSNHFKAYCRRIGLRRLARSTALPCPGWSGITGVM